MFAQGHVETVDGKEVCLQNSQQQGRLVFVYRVLLYRNSRQERNAYAVSYLIESVDSKEMFVCLGMCRNGELIF